MLEKYPDLDLQLHTLMTAVRDCRLSRASYRIVRQADLCVCYSFKDVVNAGEF